MVGMLDCLDAHNSGSVRQTPPPVTSKFAL
jgi:hypothetical protein